MSIIATINRWLVGHPLPTSAEHQERLDNSSALAILASDALSSVAYASEEILLVLIIAGTSTLSLSLPIAGAISLLLVIVGLSYRQTIRAYPQGGGAYTVAYENLGRLPGLIAAGSLLIDYILTVTVSVSAGMAALTSAIPEWYPFRVQLGIAAILALMIANLRGVKDAGRIFRLPTYGFIAMVMLLIVVGVARQMGGVTIPADAPSFLEQSAQPLTLFLILRAFAAGCTALTGIEAIANGVTVFRPPEWKNARRTLVVMIALLGALFLGITYLAKIYTVVPTEEQTVLSQLGRQIFGDSWIYYLLQSFTLLILVFAANTSFSDFPRLAHLVAEDGYLPRQLKLLGDRLVYTNGIYLLSLGAALLVIIFRGSVNALIPLYAVGVFTSFTLSQMGMVIHWLRCREKGWPWSALLNAIGSIATAIVLGVIVVTKFIWGAWIIAIAIPSLVYIFLSIHCHYQWFNRQLRIVEPLNFARISKEELQTKGDPYLHPTIVLVGQLNRGTLEALKYAELISNEIVAVHVDIGPTNRDRLSQKWKRLNIPVPLVILDSPYRALVTPVVDFVEQFEARHPDAEYITVVIPAFVTVHWWENLLHNQSTWFLRTALRHRRNRVVATVDYYLRH